LKTYTSFFLWNLNSGLTLVMQVLCHLSNHTSPFLCCVFLRWVSWTIYLGWSSMILLISVSRVAKHTILENLLGVPYSL
jgi:hypothetical protein